jgi:hypothetical protein
MGEGLLYDNGIYMSTDRPKTGKFSARMLIQSIYGKK